MEWTVVLAGPAKKSLKGIPAKDRNRIVAALGEMQLNPFQGDIRKLQDCQVSGDELAIGVYSSRSSPNVVT